MTAASSNEWQSPQALALEDALNGTKTIQAAADLLASLTITDGDIEENLDALWSLILTRAQNSADSHPKLVETLVHLADLQDAVTTEGEGEETIIIHDKPLWSGMPLLGFALRDAWNFSVRANDTTEVRQQKCQRFINVNAFAAQLTAAEEESAFDFSLLALFTFREALETGAENEGEEARLQLEGFVPAAAAWIDHAGIAIHSLDEQFPAEEGKTNAPGRGGKLWSGVPGFAQDRWKLWQTRFEALAQAEAGLSAETRAVAADAFASMKDITAGEIA